MIRAGNLDRSLLLERLSPECINEAGVSTQTWRRVTVLRAELVENERAETVTTAGEAQTRTLTFRTWWRTGLTPADQLVYEGKRYAIVAVRELGRRRALEIEARLA